MTQFKRIVLLIALFFITNMPHPIMADSVSDHYTCEELEFLTYLDLSFSNITDLNGIECATSLTNLNISFNSIADLSPLESLTNLEILKINYPDNPNLDLSILTNLTNLRHLDLEGHRRRDISDLKNLKNLRQLNLRQNKINDLSSLKPLTNLERLELSQNEIIDLSPLKNLTSLYQLQLINNLIQDISPLANLTRLTELHLTANKIDDISDLENLTNLRILDLIFNHDFDILPLANLNQLEELSLGEIQLNDITPLKNLTELKNLRIVNAQLEDITPLQYLVNLETLSLSENRISDISPLENLTNLRSLYLSDNQISDISILTSLINLMDLGLTNNAINDIPDLSNSDALFNLYLGKNNINDISILSNVQSIRRIDLSDNQINDITPLSNLTLIRSVNLSNNLVSNASVLENFIAIESLYLENNEISNISFLENLTNLKYLYLRTNQIEDISVIENQTGLRSLHLDQNLIDDISPITQLNELNWLDLAENPSNSSTFCEDILQIKDNNPHINLTFTEPTISPICGFDLIQDMHLKQAVEDALGITDPICKDLEKLTTLDLTDLSVNVSELECAINLESLNLKSAYIRGELPLSRMKKLRYLNLSSSFFPFFSNSEIDYDALGQLTDLKELYLTSFSPKDLSFLENLTNLEILHLRSDKDFIDLTSLNNLTKLRDLYLREKQLDDLSFLDYMPDLEILDLSGNSITNVPALSNLTQLKELDLSYNNISQIVILNIPSLEILDLMDNQLTDISGLSNLTSLLELDLMVNQISDITPLSQLTELKRLKLNHNLISDATPLKHLNQLEQLQLSSNQIQDISSLENLASLSLLSLRNNLITNLETIQNLSNLEGLYLSHNRINDISTLTNLPKLKTLYLQNNLVEDISPINHLPHLEHLHLENNMISDIPDLASLEKLISLNMQNNVISDISSLNMLFQLEWLDLSNNRINSIEPLLNLDKITDLYLNDNQISDLSALTNLQTIKRLAINNNLVSDLAAITQLNFHRLSILNNPLSPQAICEQIPELKKNIRPYNFDYNIPSNLEAPCILDVQELTVKAGKNRTLYNQKDSFQIKGKFFAPFEAIQSATNLNIRLESWGLVSMDLPISSTNFKKQGIFHFKGLTSSNSQAMILFDFNKGKFNISVKKVNLSSFADTIKVTLGFDGFEISTHNHLDETIINGDQPIPACFLGASSPYINMMTVNSKTNTQSNLETIYGIVTKPDNDIDITSLPFTVSYGENIKETLRSGAFDKHKKNNLYQYIRPQNLHGFISEILLDFDNCYYHLIVDNTKLPNNSQPAFLAVRLGEDLILSHSFDDLLFSVSQAEILAEHDLSSPLDGKSFIFGGRIKNNIQGIGTVQDIGLVELKFGPDPNLTLNENQFIFRDDFGDSFTGSYSVNGKNKIQLDPNTESLNQYLSSSVRNTLYNIDDDYLNTSWPETTQENVNINLDLKESTQGMTLTLNSKFTAECQLEVNGTPMTVHATLSTKAESYTPNNPILEESTWQVNEKGKITFAIKKSGAKSEATTSVKQTNLRTLHFGQNSTYNLSSNEFNLTNGTEELFSGNYVANEKGQILYFPNFDELAQTIENLLIQNISKIAKKQGISTVNQVSIFSVTAFNAKSTGKVIPQKGISQKLSYQFEIDLSINGTAYTITGASSFQLKSMTRP